MKKIDLGQTISILANAGVIAGIVFLGYELRQNNELLTVQASYTQFEIERGRRSRLVENIGGITDLVTRESAGEELSETDSTRLFVLWLDVVDSWEWQYRENHEGRLPDSVINIEDWRGQFDAYLGLRDVYERTKPRREPGFLQFMEDTVLAR